MSKTNIFLDNRNGYGLISRVFHWLMAILFLWQFISALLRVFAKDTELYNFFWSAHHQLGFALLILVFLRGLWGLLNISRRPHKHGHAGKLALLGHLVIYGLQFRQWLCCAHMAAGGASRFLVFVFLSKRACRMPH